MMRCDGVLVLVFHDKKFYSKIKPEPVSEKGRVVCRRLGVDGNGNMDMI